ncbi:unnamed protein product [Peniophora sp. CBMAI 1063]|nr:unnamed protein product [Peniophora sp. CBMAI 1063]
MGRHAVTTNDFDDAATYSLGGSSLDADILRPPSVVVDGPALFKLLSQKSRSVRQLQRAVEDLADQHSQECSRADNAQRQATMIAASLRDVQRDLERERSDHSVTREELGMYKVQLSAQQEVTRKAQINIDDLTRRLERAEQDAADARTVAHQLREELQVIRAREQGRNEGFRAAIRVRSRMDSEGASRGRRRAMSVDDSVDEVLIERRSPVTVRERSATPARRSSSRTASVRAPMPAPMPTPVPRAQTGPPPPPIENLPFGSPFTEDEDSIPSGSSPLSSSYTTSESIDVRQRKHEAERGAGFVVPPQVTTPARATPSREQRGVMPPPPVLHSQPQPQPQEAPRQRRMSRLSLKRQSRSGSRGPAEAKQDPQPKTTTKPRGRVLSNVTNIYAPSSRGPGSDVSNDLIPRAHEEPGTGRMSIYLPTPHEMARAETPRRPENFHVVQSPESGVSGLSVPVIPAEAPPRPPTAPPKQPPPRLSMSRPNSAPPVPRSPEAYNPPPPTIYAVPTPVHPVPRKPIPTPVPGPQVKSGLLGPYSHHAPSASAISSDYDLLRDPRAPSTRPGSAQQPMLQVRNPDPQGRPGSRSLKRSIFRRQPQQQSMGMVMEEVQRGTQPKREHSPTSTPSSSSASPPPPPSATRPNFNRGQSSGYMIPIQVESPSPETSPQYEPVTPISHPDLLSPDFAARPLPAQPPPPMQDELKPRAPQQARETTYPASSITNDTLSTDRYRPRPSRHQTYEYAPVPDQVQYPRSPIAPMSPETQTAESEETPRDGQAVLPGGQRPFSVKVETIGSSTSDAMSTTGLGFLGLRGFPGKKLFRRHT